MGGASAGPTMPECVNANRQLAWAALPYCPIQAGEPNRTEAYSPVHADYQVWDMRQPLSILKYVL